MSPDEATLQSWNLLTSYKRHKQELVNLAEGVCLSLCSTYKKHGQPLPTLAECQQLYWQTLRVHPLYWQTILQKEKPHITPNWYGPLVECLGRHIVQQHWKSITSIPCP